VPDSPGSHPVPQADPAMASAIMALSRPLNEASESDSDSASESSSSSSAAPTMAGMRAPQPQPSASQRSTLNAVTQQIQALGGSVPMSEVPVALRALVLRDERRQFDQFIAMNGRHFSVRDGVLYVNSSADSASSDEDPRLRPNGHAKGKGYRPAGDRQNGKGKGGQVDDSSSDEARKGKGKGWSRWADASSSDSDDEPFVGKGKGYRYQREPTWRTEQRILKGKGKGKGKGRYDRGLAEPDDRFQNPSVVSDASRRPGTGWSAPSSGKGWEVEGPGFTSRPVSMLSGKGKSRKPDGDATGNGRRQDGPSTAARMEGAPWDITDTNDAWEEGYEQPLRDDAWDQGYQQPSRGPAPRKARSQLSDDDGASSASDDVAKEDPTRAPEIAEAKHPQWAPLVAQQNVVHVLKHLHGTATFTQIQRRLKNFEVAAGIGLEIFIRANDSTFQFVNGKVVLVGRQGDLLRKELEEQNKAKQEQAQREKHKRNWDDSGADGWRTNEEAWNQDWGEGWGDAWDQWEGDEWSEWATAGPRKKQTKKSKSAKKDWEWEQDEWAGWYGDDDEWNEWDEWAAWKERPPRRKVAERQSKQDERWDGYTAREWEEWEKQGRWEPVKPQEKEEVVKASPPPPPPPAPRGSDDDKDVKPKSEEPRRPQVAGRGLFGRALAGALSGPRPARRTAESRTSAVADPAPESKSEDLTQEPPQKDKAEEKAPERPQILDQMPEPKPDEVPSEQPMEKTEHKPAARSAIDLCKIEAEVASAAKEASSGSPSAGPVDCSD